jgi:hypothetical protein
MANLDAVRREVVNLWEQRSRQIKEPTTGDMLAFFGKLRSERSDLFVSAFKGDPWQTIHAWLSEYERTWGATRRAP